MVEINIMLDIYYRGVYYLFSNRNTLRGKNGAHDKGQTEID